MTTAKIWSRDSYQLRSQLCNLAWLSSALFAGTHWSEAQLINGGFETGSLAPAWQSTGIATVTDSSFGVTPVEGTFQARLDTASSTSAANLETFLFGSSSGQLSLLGNGTAIQGSAIKQTISVPTEETLQVSFNFLTTEDPNLVGHANDFAFLTIGSGNTFTIAAVEDSPLTTAPAATGYDLHTGYHSYTLTFPAGTYTLGIGLVDVTDSNNPSGLLLDNISVVPEPAGSSIPLALGLLLFGLGHRTRFGQRYL